jgi:hypothetical protein
MAFSEVFSGPVGSSPISIGVVESNSFVLIGSSPAQWVKVRIGLVVDFPGIGSVEIGHQYVPIGDSRKVHCYVPYRQIVIFGILSATVEIISRWPLKELVSLTVLNGESKEMIFDVVSRSDITAAIASNTEVNTDVLNVAPGPGAVLRPANAARTGGIITSGVNGTIYIGFGVAPAKKASSALAKGSRIDIPNLFKGEIFVDWNGLQTAVVPPGQSGQFVNVVEYQT